MSLPPYSSIPQSKLVKKRKNDGESVDYSTLSKPELIEELIRVKSHLNQLKVLMDKAQASTNGELNSEDASKSVASKRSFDFNKFNKRHVLIKLAYLGWNFHGFTTQEGIFNTVENHMFKALEKTKLIENRQTSNYHRCGRTDKGVSAFCQVISIDVRSNCASGVGVIVNPLSNVKNESIDNEINYVKLLNGVLPDEIRAIGWCPVDETFSSRFDCDSRSYRYYFPRGDLDIPRMERAAQKLIGEHDYRNFCKMDVANGVVTFYRRLDKITFTELDKTSNKYGMVEVMVQGSSFLWHQIRCIIAILLLVGQQKEEESIVEELLDVEKWDGKPHYNISSELPLVLFDCTYKNVNWICPRVDKEKLIKNLQDLWIDNETKSTMIRRMMDYLEEDLGGEESKETSEVSTKTKTNHRTLDQPYTKLQGKSVRLDYVELKKRNTSKSLENRIEHYVKRRRIDEEFVNQKIKELNERKEQMSTTQQQPNENEESG